MKEVDNSNTHVYECCVESLVRPVPEMDTSPNSFVRIDESRGS
jgi:hypothetical protein